MLGIPVPSDKFCWLAASEHQAHCVSSFCDTTIAFAQEAAHQMQQA